MRSTVPQPGTGARLFRAVQLGRRGRRWFPALSCGKSRRSSGDPSTDLQNEDSSAARSSHSPGGEQLRRAARSSPGRFPRLPFCGTLTAQEARGVEQAFVRIGERARSPLRSPPDDRHRRAILLRRRELVDNLVENPIRVRPPSPDTVPTDPLMRAATRENAGRKTLLLQSY